MPAPTPFEQPAKTAELKFRDAFARLRNCRPQRLPKGSKLTQNNVAREAGVDPSALRRARFPELIAEIQAWVEAHAEDETQKSPRQRLLAVRGRNRGLRQRLIEVTQQRDLAAAKVILLEERLVALTVENERLKVRAFGSDSSPLRVADRGLRPSKR